MGGYGITLFIGTNPITYNQGGHNMSDVQSAIEELVVSEVDNRIEDAISENHEIASMKDDISSLEQKFEDVEHTDHDQIVQDVLLQITKVLCNKLEDDYVMVKKVYLETLQKKTSDLIQTSGEEG